MTAKQWAARALIAATMAAMLSACGGGGGSAEPTVKVAPEELKAGLTVKESSDPAFKPAEYNTMKVIDAGTDIDTDTEYGRYAEFTGADRLELLVRFSKSTGLVSRVTLVKDPAGATWQAMGCGFDGFTCDNSRISVNPTTNEIRVTSLALKSLAFTSGDSTGIISHPETHLATTPGAATVSGALTTK